MDVGISKFPSVELDMREQYSIELTAIILATLQNDMAEYFMEVTLSSPDKELLEMMDVSHVPIVRLSTIQDVTVELVRLSIE
jgi:hypothetical protein